MGGDNFVLLFSLSFFFYSCPLSLSPSLPQAVVSRELVQLDDLLQWAEKNLEGETDTIAEALLVREEANKVVQVRERQENQSVWSPR